MAILCIVGEKNFFEICCLSRVVMNFKRVPNNR